VTAQMPNPELAARARQLAARSPAGSPDRRSYGCLAVALSTTGTTASARRALDLVTQAAVRSAALEALERLTEPDHPQAKEDR
jgi:hypothetical protein